MLKALRASTHPALPALGQPASTTRERSPGIYLDSRGIEHGFIRDASGFITSFDPLESPDSRRP